MQALWLENNQLQLRHDIPIPQPPPGEALVRVVRAGICNTDLELIRGYYPYKGILGHEFVGVVEQGPTELQGQRVVGEINAVCGQCHYCQSGQSTHCENRTVLGIANRHGAFADYLSLPIKNLHRVPDTLPTDLATFTEPVAAALEIQQQVTVSSTERVLVVGDGKLGQLVAQTLALTGCDLFVVGRHQHKLANLSARGINGGFADAIAHRSFDIAVECTGNPAGFELARRALRPRGILVLKSTYAGQLTFDASSLVVDEITLIGSRCGPFAPALELLASGRVDVKPLIQGHYPLREGIKAVEQAKTKGVLKVLLDMSDQ
ncbi:MAG: alcohol dehydrogenase catalytic domain-containing protein [Coleofasciculus chthonoplastes F3-SA18-01]|uniref:MDR/zinc-dependent alcohol dehydrogenase-like family protein n=1 Tax=Coleofasciculus chthonoplastes TaxID=64178 RepID=UPI0032FBC8C5